MATAKKRKRRRLSAAGWILLFLMFVTTMLGVYGIVHLLTSPTGKSSAEEILPSETETQIPTEAETETETAPPTEAPTEKPPLVEYPAEDEATVRMEDNDVNARYAVLVDCNQHRIVSEKNANVRMYPASMTKLMTIIVAIEHIKDFQDTFELPEEVIESCWSQEASMAGFSAGEPCTMMDMLYGAALPSGADATIGLACYVSGSERAFVRLMNRKVKELGLKDTHFVNSSGLHDENHYSTAADMAVILEYCLQNELCRQVISTAHYTTSSTENHPDGIYLSDTMFNKMSGDEVPGIAIKGGKTGFTDEAGQCMASYGETNDGHCYIVVTAKGTDRFQPVYDCVKLYGDAVRGIQPEAVPEATLAPEAAVPPEIEYAEPQEYAPAA